ncbi:putative leader peptide [Streptomyces sp. NPDC059690]|uniref:putative leader peptide n=1 Tax=Streptomyces sp. NPDC059690 TaxID=3346907 RepID=UPI0036BE14C5
MRDCLVQYMNILLGWTSPSATIPSKQVGNLGIRGVGMRARDLAQLSLPLLTSRRHIDLRRTSSAICCPF